MISAEIHSDDFVFKVKFDAVPWFEQATYEEVAALIKCDWRGDYAADAVAKFFEDTNPEIETLLHYCRENDFGFEVSIDEKEALKWLSIYRPHFHQMLIVESSSFLKDLRDKEMEVCKEILKLDDIDGIQQVSGFIVTLKNIIRRQEKVIADLKTEQFSKTEVTSNG